MIDNNLEGFHNTWNMVLSELTYKPDDSTLLFWYFKQIQNFKPMAEDIAHFKRAQWSKSPDYSFDWLWGAPCRYLAQKRSDYMQESLSRSLVSKPYHAAPGTSQEKGHGKDNKGKNKRPQSQTPKDPKGGHSNSQPPGGEEGAGAGKGKDRPPRDGSRGKAGLCFSFQKGTCTKGKECYYLHEKERTRSPTPKGGGRKSGTQCPFFVKGTCKFGDACMDKHGGSSNRSPSNDSKGKGNNKGTPKPDKPPVAAPAISTRRDPFTAEAGTVIKSALRARVPRVVPSGTALAAAYDYVPSDRTRSWLMDTGCKYDLTTRASVPPGHQDLITDAIIPLTVSTANGLVSCTQVVGTQIGGFGEVAEPYLLDATPDILPIGRRCVEEGCEFHWGPFSLSPSNNYRKGHRRETHFARLLSVPR